MVKGSRVYVVLENPLNNEDNVNLIKSYVKKHKDVKYFVNYVGVNVIYTDTMDPKFADVNRDNFSDAIASCEQRREDGFFIEFKNKELVKDFKKSLPKDKIRKWKLKNNVELIQKRNHDFRVFIKSRKQSKK